MVLGAAGVGRLVTQVMHVRRVSTAQSSPLADIAFPAVVTVAHIAFALSLSHGPLEIPGRKRQADAAASGGPQWPVSWYLAADGDRELLHLTSVMSRTRRARLSRRRAPASAARLYPTLFTGTSVATAVICSTHNRELLGPLLWNQRVPVHNMTYAGARGGTYRFMRHDHHMFAPVKPGLQLPAKCQSTGAAHVRPGNLRADHR